MFLPLHAIKAGVAKLADALDLGSSAARHGGSSPSARTYKTQLRKWLFFFGFHADLRRWNPWFSQMRTVSSYFSFLISHFSFLISHFSFFIFHFVTRFTKPRFFWWLCELWKHACEGRIADLPDLFEPIRAYSLSFKGKRQWFIFSFCGQSACCRGK